jgi:hypothetical protein
VISLVKIFIILFFLYVQLSLGKNLHFVFFRKQEPGSSSEHGGENPNVSPQHNVLRDPRDIRDQLFRLPLNQAYPMGL